MKNITIKDFINFHIKDNQTMLVNRLQDEGIFEHTNMEVYEWYLIDDWLAFKLEKCGESILANDYGYWWGRTCTGQAIDMDHVIQNLYNLI